MFFFQPLSTIKAFVQKLRKSLVEIDAPPLTSAQKLWLSVCITGIIVTNYVSWKNNDKQLKNQGVPKKERPKQPQKNKNYKSTIEVAISTVEAFKNQFPNITVKAILADALYGAKTFYKPVKKLYPNTQIISQAKKNQKILDK